MVKYLPLIQTILIVISLLVNLMRPKEPHLLLITLSLILVSGIIYLVFGKDKRTTVILGEIGLLLISLAFLGLVLIVVLL